MGIDHNATTHSRRARNIVFVRRSWLDSLAEGTPCLTASGVFGRCTAFKTCYPQGKPSGGVIFNSWYRQFEQCSYFNSGGQQFIGICYIADDKRYETVLSQWPPIGVPTHATRKPGITTRKPAHFQWPPPIPTHPPNHAAPTHPPLGDRTTKAPWQTSTTKVPWQISTTKSPWQTSTTKAPWQTSTTKAPWQTTTRRAPWQSSTTTKAPWQTWPTTTRVPWQTSTTKAPWQTTTKSPWQTTTRRWTSTLKPQTTTRFPAQWPPPIPTHPPSHYPVQPAEPPSSVDTSHDDSFTIPNAACGLKNAGFQDEDQQRIVGGQNASPNEWPWIVVMFNNGRQFCGGSIIDNIHILTAAHCVSQMSAYDVARITVHLGDHDIRNSYEVQHVVRRIKRVVRHKGFDFSHLHNDVAVLTMDQPVQFSSTIRPICLPSASSAKSYRGIIATVAGWGSLRENGPQPSVLQKVTIPIWSNADCSRKYGSAAPAGIANSMICAGQATKDSCSGDSGGPMMVDEGGGRWVQVGIVSWGIGCGKGQYPGVYSRVSSFLPWIAKNIQ
ncbi:transmembrane protease serine 9 [Condylostylus longicornis]|uniref:transmembrane protease serine 9 n=1 Tax=Condylostylus longicornis TaxID=2530218 RepID=UPI00244E5B8F|nr:transmembrane protease serine 9 [Condylostylus longicornis]